VARRSEKVADSKARSASKEFQKAPSPPSNDILICPFDLNFYTHSLNFDFDF
jgi:hypothetical protein